MIPLGCLPSAQSRPVGSSQEEILAEDNALCKMTFSMHGMTEVATSAKTATACVPMCPHLIHSDDKGEGCKVGPPDEGQWLHK